MPPAPSTAPAAIDAIDVLPSPAADDRAARREALRDLAAMTGVEVFY